MNSLFKRITAFAIATAMSATMALSASAENVAENWIAVYQVGAPTSVNKTYVYDDVPAFGDGYIVDCTSFKGGYNSLVNGTAPGNVTFRFTTTGTQPNIFKYKASYGDYVSFKFSVNSSTNCTAGGRILYNM